MARDGGPPLGATAAAVTPRTPKGHHPLALDRRTLPARGERWAVGGLSGRGCSLLLPRSLLAAPAPVRFYHTWLRCGRLLLQQLSGCGLGRGFKLAVRSGLHPDRPRSFFLRRFNIRPGRLRILRRGQILRLLIIRCSALRRGLGAVLLRHCLAAFAHPSFGLALPSVGRAGAVVRRRGRRLLPTLWAGVAAQGASRGSCCWSTGGGKAVAVVRGGRRWLLGERYESPQL